MRFDDKLYLDIDCLFESIEVNGKIINSIFPITLIFNEVENLKIEINHTSLNKEGSHNQKLP